MTLVETFNHPAFLVHVGEAEWTLYLGHSLFFTPCHHGVEEAGKDIIILDKVEPTETHCLFIPALIDRIVDNTRHTAHYLFAAIGKPQFQVAVVERGVFLGQKTQLIIYQGWDVCRYILEKLVGKLNKGA